MSEHQIPDLIAEMRNAAADAQEALDAVTGDLSVHGWPKDINYALTLHDLATRLTKQYEELYRLLDDTT